MNLFCPDNSTETTGQLRSFNRFPRQPALSQPDHCWFVIGAGAFGTGVIQAIREVCPNDPHFLHVDDSSERIADASEIVWSQSLDDPFNPRLTPGIPVLVLCEIEQFPTVMTQLKAVLDRVSRGRDAWCFSLSPEADISVKSVQNLVETTKQDLAIQVSFILAERYRNHGHPGLKGQIDLTSHLLRRGLVLTMFEVALRLRAGGTICQRQLLDSSLNSKEPVNQSYDTTRRRCPIIRFGGAAVWAPDRSPDELAVRLELLQLVKSTIKPPQSVNEPVLHQLTQESIFNELNQLACPYVSAIPTEILRGHAASILRIRRTGPGGADASSPESSSIATETVPDQSLNELEAPLSTKFAALVDQWLSQVLAEPELFQSVIASVTKLNEQLIQIATQLAGRGAGIWKQAEDARLQIQALRNSQSVWDILFRWKRRRLIREQMQEQTARHRSAVAAFISEWLCERILRQTVARLQRLVPPLEPWRAQATHIERETRSLLRPPSNCLIQAISPAVREQASRGLIDDARRDQIFGRFRDSWSSTIKSVLTLSRLASNDDQKPRPDAIWVALKANLERCVLELSCATQATDTERITLNSTLTRSLLRERAEPAPTGGPQAWISREIPLNDWEHGRTSPILQADSDSPILPADRLPALLWLHLPVTQVSPCAEDLTDSNVAMVSTSVHFPDP